MATPHRRQLPCDLIIRDADEGLRLISSSSDVAINLNNKGIPLSFLWDPDRKSFKTLQRAQANMSGPSPNLAINLINQGIRLSFLRDPDRETFSWYSTDLIMLESALHHITIELPQSRFYHTTSPSRTAT
ncbi:hypothetical protein H9Q72_009064 [Fusarium xylarioides]|uniref:Uncharacterized protein n=1 Tax=Fusarium xylarioides TaxID=221167 RepID=A0A9P7HSJ8_9HYPO|nr:hypothetical protein H9Q70_005226 [Fusarium xylarioides]KAG5762839.1 hypothetical protein H9Q72_009064 [Fusarium xylarioides]